MSGKKGRIDYTVGLQNQSFRCGAGGRTNIFNAAGERTEARDDVFTGSGEESEGQRQADLGRPRKLDRQFQRLAPGLLSTIIAKAGERVSPGLADRIRLVANDEDSWILRARRRLSSSPSLGGRLKLIGLAQRRPHALRAGRPDQLRRRRRRTPAAVRRDRRHAGADRPRRISLEMGQERSASSPPRARSTASTMSATSSSCAPTASIDEIPLPGRHRDGEGGPLRGHGQPTAARCRRSSPSSSPPAANIRTFARPAPAASAAPSGAPRDCSRRPGRRLRGSTST